jgi:hypothetical protein
MPFRFALGFNSLSSSGNSMTLLKWLLNQQTESEESNNPWSNSYGRVHRQSPLWRWYDLNKGKLNERVENSKAETSVVDHARFGLQRDCKMCRGKGAGQRIRDNRGVSADNSEAKPCTSNARQL